MTSPLLAQANFGVFVVVFRTGKWGWLLLWVVRIFPPPVIRFPLPVIRGPANITLQDIVGRRPGCVEQTQGRKSALKARVEVTCSRHPT